MDVKETRYTQCPKSIMDAPLINAAFEAHELFSSGFLPESGTIYDQTEFFYKASLIVKQKLKQMEADAMKQAKES